MLTPKGLGHDLGSRISATHYGSSACIARRDVADVFVVLGITGDLAKVMAVHGLSKRDRGVPEAAKKIISGYGRWHRPWVVT